MKPLLNSATQNDDLLEHGEPSSRPPQDGELFGTRARFKPGLLAQTLDEIKEEPMRWLWKDRIPLGSVTLLAAEPNTGKSYLTIGIAALGSRGEALPGNSDPLEFETLLFEMEDSKGTVKERARLCAAVGDKVRVVNSVARNENAETPFSISDVDLLEDHLHKHPATRLVVINPLAAILDPGTNDYRELEVRHILSRLQRIAHSHDVAILVVRHFRKKNAEQQHGGMDRVMGSGAFVAAVRSALGIEIDGDRRYVICIKNNLGKTPPPVAFRIDDQGLGFEGEDLSYRSINEPANPESRLEQCIAWLQGELDAGAVRSAELEGRALAAGHSQKTYQRAKKNGAFRSYSCQVDGQKIWFTKLTAGDADQKLAGISNASADGTLAA